MNIADLEKGGLPCYWSSSIPNSISNGYQVRTDVINENEYTNDYPGCSISTFAGFKIIIHCLLVLACLCGCAGKQVVLPQVPTGFGHQTEMEAANCYWWDCRFKIYWPPHTYANFTVDLLLARSVVAPTLQQYAPRIKYWRFHRRAARDGAGHQFSFLFYAEPATAEKIFAAIEHNEILQKALARGVVEKLLTDDPDRPVRPNIEDTSDHHWSPEMQRQWPVYIMGVSGLWLGLIDEAMAREESEDGPPGGLTLEDLLARYKKAEEEVTNLWNREGEHALLHHLNAIFGYEPITLRKQIVF